MDHARCSYDMRDELPLTLSRTIRRAMLDLGFSPDSHIYDFRGDRLLYAKNTASNRLIHRALLLYDLLGDFDRRVFVCEFLESGRHYPFWYMQFANRKRFLRAMKNVGEIVFRVFR